MPVYQPGIPTGTVNLDLDYLNIQGNFMQANIVYGTDHYPFDNATPNQGFHNVVTTPIVVNNPPDGLPPATTTNPKFYAFQQSTALGVLQYSRGPSNVVPTPVTSKQSSSGPTTLGPGASVTILDFTGIARAMCSVYAMDTAILNNASTRIADVFYSAGTFFIQNGGGGIGLNVTSSGSNLQLTNGAASPRSNIYWTIEFARIQ